MIADSVNAQDRRVGMFVLDKWGNCANADTQGTDEDKRLIVIPTSSNIFACNEFAASELLHVVGHAVTSLGDLYDGY